MPAACTDETGIATPIGVYVMGAANRTLEQALTEQQRKALLLLKQQLKAQS